MTTRLGFLLRSAFAGALVLLVGVLPDAALPTQVAPAGAQEVPGQVTVVNYGPFNLPPAGAGGDVDHANVFLPDLEKPCQDCYLLEAVPDLVYPDGTPANLDTGVMLHHAVFFNTGRRDATCGTDGFFGPMGERFLASGNERTARRYSPGFGYHLGRAPINGIFHVMNHSSEPVTVYFRYTIRWVSAAGTSGIRPVTPVWMDINNCRTSEYRVPAGASATQWRWPSTLTGRVIASGGHVHDYGIRTTLSNATTGAHLCTAWAGYGTNPAYMGSIESMSTCGWDALGTVRAGELLQVEAAYDTPEPIDDAMGIMVVHVYETTDVDGGTEASPEARGARPPASAGSPPADGHRSHH